MTKKEKPEIKTIEDVQQLPAEEQTKWEIANELGYFDKIVATGWKSLPGKRPDRWYAVFPHQKDKFNGIKRNEFR